MKAKFRKLSRFKRNGNPCQHLTFGGQHNESSSNRRKYFRKDSYNLKLVKHVQKRDADQFEVEILDLAPLPMYHQDIQLDAPKKFLISKRKSKKLMLFLG